LRTRLLGARRFRRTRPLDARLRCLLLRPGPFAARLIAAKRHGAGLLHPRRFRWTRLLHLPGLLDAVGGAAERFVDSAGYANAVLGGRPPPAIASTLHGPNLGAYLYAAASVGGAVAVAAAALSGVRDRAPRFGRRSLEGLRALHSGRPGDYAAFTAAGVAVLGALVALAAG